MNMIPSLSNPHGDVVPLEFRTATKVTVPAEFLLDLHNQSPADSPVCAMVLRYIMAYAESNAKAHWARGIVQKPDGTLYLDTRLVDRAIRRGKQDTYTKTAEEAFDTLKQAVEQISYNQQAETAAIESLEKVDFGGVPLVAFAEPSKTAARLKEQADGLAKLGAMMQTGLAGALTSPSPERRLDTPDRLPVDEQ